MKKQQLQVSHHTSDSDDDAAWINSMQLFIAIHDDKLDKVKALLENGVKADIIDKTYKENTPLHYAVQLDKEEIVAELLKPQWKINIDLKNNKGMTALDIAIRNNNVEIIQLLKNHHQTKTDDLVSSQAVTTEEHISVSPTFQRTPGSGGIEGQLCEIKLVMLLLLKGTTNQQVRNFFLASNMERADKFDDIVFKYENRIGTSKIVFLQSKHKKDDKSDIGEKQKGINLNGLLSDSETGDFALNRYFISYRKIKQNFLNNKDGNDPIFSGNFEDCEFLLYTNAPFDYARKKCIKEFTLERSDFLGIADSNSKYFQLEFNSDERDRIISILKNSSDCRRLAKALVEAFSSGKGMDMNKEIFQCFHKALKEKVIERTGDYTGKLSDHFLDKDDLFQKVFYEEALKIFKNKPLNIIKEHLKEKHVKLSTKFCGENPTGSADLPNDEPIFEHEIQDYLKKFKLYAFQPNEKALEDEIKEIAKQFYKIDHQDLDSVFADVEYQIRNWWQAKNYYLTKENKFFENAARVSVQFGVKEPVAFFTGRLQELADLHRILQQGGEAVISQKVSITGLGGVGKSELARKYLSKHRKDYDNNIIWINADNFYTIAESFRRLAEDKLGINCFDEKGKEKDIKLVAEEVYGYFAKRHRKSIFVFDNAEKYKVVGDAEGGVGIDTFIPQLTANKPFIIITSRDQEWGEIKHLPIGVFSTEEAVDFIKKSLKGKTSINENEAIMLAEELDHLPLALSQAVAYISVENQESNKWSPRGLFTISNYLEQFKQSAVDLLNLGLNDQRDRYSQTVLTTWKMTKSKIVAKKMRGGEQALEMIHVMAYLAPDQIPVDEIFETGVRDEDLRHSAVELLDQYSMVHLQGGKVNIHRLVQQVTRIELEHQRQNEEIMERTLGFLKDSFPYFNDKLEESYKKRRLLPHFEAFLVRVDELLKMKSGDRDKIQQNYLLNMFHLMADGYDGYPERRKQLLERELSIKEQIYGPDHVKVAVTLTNLGGAYTSLGDAEKAKQLLERALKINENHYGHDHFVVAKTLSNLANAYGCLGNEEKKIQFLEHALVIEENYYELDDIELAKTLINLGNAYGASGDAQKQRQLLERALAMVEAYYGPNHFQVSLALGSLANAYGDLGDAKKKVLLLERALTIEEIYYGPDHYHVAKTLTNLGGAFGDLGDAQKAVQLLERALVIIESFYGPNHYEVAVVLTNLGNAYNLLGHVQKSVTLFERALAIEEEYYGPDHFHVAVALGNLGSAYEDMGDAQKSVQLLERALKISENFYGPNHFKVAMALSNLGSAYGALGHALKKVELLDRAVKIKEAYYPHDHYQVALTLGGLANAYGDLGEEGKKVQLLERVLTILEKHYGPDHCQVGATLTNLGCAYEAFGDSHKSMQLLERALAIHETYYGPDHFETAKTLINLGNTYGSLGDAPKKVQLLERALTINEAFYGPDHFETGIALVNLGNGYGDIGDVKKKICLLERALRIHESHYGPGHVKVAVTLTNLGNAYESLNDFQKSKEIFLRAFTIKENYYGADHTKVAEALVKLANAYGKSGDSQMQIQLLEEALPILLKARSQQLTFSSYSLDNVKYLIEKGLDVLQRDNHDTILHKAVSSNNPDIVRLILNKIKERHSERFSEHLNVKDAEGDTPLMWAAEHGRTHCAQVLLENGADINAQNYNGETALHWATKGSFQDVVQLLINENADSSIKDVNGKTPFDMAQAKLLASTENHESDLLIAGLMLSVLPGPVQKSE